MGARLFAMIHMWDGFWTRQLRSTAMGTGVGPSFAFAKAALTISGSKHFLNIMLLCVSLLGMSWFYGGSKILLHNKLNEKRSSATLTKAFKKLHLSMLAKPHGWEGCSNRLFPKSKAIIQWPWMMVGWMAIRAGVSWRRDPATFPGGSRPPSPGGLPYGGQLPEECHWGPIGALS